MFGWASGLSPCMLHIYLIIFHMCLMDISCVCAAQATPVVCLQSGRLCVVLPASQQGPPKGILLGTSPGNID